jgi:hypothetical protein
MLSYGLRRDHLLFLLQVLLLMEHCNCGSLHAGVVAGVLRRHIVGSSCFSNMVTAACFLFVGGINDHGRAGHPVLTHGFISDASIRW